MDNKKWMDQYREIFHLSSFYARYGKEDFLNETDFGNLEGLNAKRSKLDEEFWFHFENYLKESPKIVLEGFFCDCLMKFPLLWKNRELRVLSYIERACPVSEKLDNAAFLLDVPEMKAFMKSNLDNPEIRKQSVDALCSVAARTFQTGWGDINRKYIYQWLPTWLNDFPEIAGVIMAIVEDYNERSSYFVWTAIYTGIKKIYLSNNY